jgi:membrane-associated phospholipid phosphatase
MANKIYSLWLPTFILVASFLLNYFYSKPLFQLGESLIFKAQQHSSPTLDAFFIFFTFLIEPYFVISSLAVALTLFRKKLEGSIITIAVLLNTYIFMAMKAFLTSPRPFWTDKHIKNIGYYCPKDYGSPSGHTEFAVFIFSIYLFHFNKQKNMIVVVLGFGVIALVMISRMYLGGHSLDQVLFGFIVAACLSIIYEFGGIREKIAELLVRFSQSQVRKKVLAFCFLAHFLAIAIYFRNLSRDESFYSDISDWMGNFKNKCSSEISSSTLNESSLLAESVLITFSLGYFFSFQTVLKDRKGSTFLAGNWRFNT